jgi:hypothetical protein
MNRLLLTVGLVFTGVFLLTGISLKMTFASVLAVDPGMRATLRSLHIYLLLVSLLSGILGLHLRTAPGGYRGHLHRLGAAGMLVAPVIIAIAFAVAAIRMEPVPQLVGAGLILATGACLLHLIAHSPTLTMRTGGSNSDATGVHSGDSVDSEPDEKSGAPPS